MDFKSVLFLQYPALALFAVLFFLRFLINRTKAAFRCAVDVLLFATCVAGSSICALLGAQAELQLFPLTAWSWGGIAVAGVILLAMLIVRIQQKLSRRNLEKKLKKAGEEKERAVEAARTETREATLQEVREQEAMAEAAYWEEQARLDEAREQSEN